MPRGMCGIARKGRIRNKHMLSNVCVALIKDKIVEYLAMGARMEDLYQLLCKTY